MNWLFHHYEIILCISDSGSVLKSTFSDISIDILDVFWLVLVWYIFSCPFALMCLCLFNVHFLQACIVGSCLRLSDNTYLLIGMFRSFTFTVIVDMVHFKSIILLFSLSHLFIVFFFFFNFVLCFGYYFMVLRPFKHPGCHPGLASIYLKINVDLI